MRDTDTNKIHPAVAMGGLRDLCCNIAAPDRARFSSIHGSTVLCSTDRVGVDGSYLLFCFKEKFCRMITKREMDYLILEMCR